MANETIGILSYRQSPRWGATANLVKTEYDGQNQKDDHHPGPDRNAFEEILFWILNLNSRIFKNAPVEVLQDAHPGPKQ